MCGRSAFKTGIGNSPGCVACPANTKTALGATACEVITHQFTVLLTCGCAVQALVHHGPRRRQLRVPGGPRDRCGVVRAMHRRVRFTSCLPCVFSPATELLMSLWVRSAFKSDRGNFPCVPCPSLSKTAFGGARLPNCHLLRPHLRPCCFSPQAATVSASRKRTSPTLEAAKPAPLAVPASKAS